MPFKLPVHLRRVKSVLPVIRKYYERMSKTESNIKAYRIFYLKIENQLLQFQESLQEDNEYLKEIEENYIMNSCDIPMRVSTSFTRKTKSMIDPNPPKKTPESTVVIEDSEHKPIILSDIPRRRRESILELNSPARHSPLIKKEVISPKKNKKIGRRVYQSDSPTIRNRSQSYLY